MIAKRNYLFAAAAATLVFGFAATAANADGIFHTEVDDLRGGQNHAKEGRPK